MIYVEGESFYLRMTIDLFFIGGNALVLVWVVVLFSANFPSIRQWRQGQSQGQSHDVKPSRIIGSHSCAAAAVAGRCHGNDEVQRTRLRSVVVLRPRVHCRTLLCRTFRWRTVHGRTV